MIAASCDRETLIGFLTNRINIDERLDFLVHLESCTRCWEEIYNARKAEHPHYYKSNNRQVKVTDHDLKRFDSPAREEESNYQVA